MKKIGNKQALQSLIDETVKDDHKSPDEFTMLEFYEQAIASGKSMTMNAVRSHLTRLREAGKITSRMGRQNSRSCRFYRIAK